jgi:uncharacterized protein (DUF58 family)
MLRGLSREPEMTAYKVVTLLASGFFLALVAIAVHQPSVYFMSACCLSVLVVAFFASRFSLGSLSWERRTSDRVFDGDNVKVEIRLRSRSRVPRFLVTVEDTLSPWLETEAAPSFLIPVLWPGREIVLSYEARARRRGRLELGPLEVVSGDPLGLLTQRRRLPAMSQALIYPRPVELGARELGGADMYEALMSRENAAAREGLDFHGVRDYQAGDELKHIHWKATARHGRLSVIEFDREPSPETTVVLDLQRGTEVGQDIHTTLEYGVKIAASLASHALQRGGRLSFEARDGRRRYHLEVIRLDHLFQLYEILAVVEADGPEPVSRLVAEAARDLRPGSSLTVITPALTPMLAQQLQQLLSRRATAELILLEASTFDAAAGPTLARREHTALLAEQLGRAGAAVRRVARGENLAEALRSSDGGARRSAS